MGKKGKGKKSTASSGGGDPQASSSSVQQSQQVSTAPAGRAHGQQQSAHAARTVGSGGGQPQQQITPIEGSVPAVQAQSLHRERARNLEVIADVTTAQSISQPDDESLGQWVTQKGRKEKLSQTQKQGTVQPASQPVDETFSRSQAEQAGKGRKDRQQPTSAAFQPRTQAPAQPAQLAQQTQKQQQLPPSAQAAPAPQPSAWGRGTGVWSTGRGAGRGQPLQPAGRGVGRGRGQPGHIDVAPGIAPGRVRQVSETSGTSGGSPYRQQQQLLHQPHVAAPQPTSSQLQETAAANVVKKPAEVETTKLELEIPPRKNLRKGGTCGTEFPLETNQVPLKIDSKIEIACHYDVAITPDKPKRMMRLVWNAFCEQYLHQYKFAFDDVKNAYSPSRLPEDVSGEVLVVEDNFSQPKKYVVQVRFAAEVNLRALFDYMKTGCKTPVPQKALQCIDIVLRNACALRFVRVNRSFFSEPRDQIISLGGGLELWHGFFQSAVIGWKPFLNVDVTHKGFIEPQSVIQLLEKMTRDLNRLSKYDIENVSTFLQGVKVEYQIPNQPTSRRKYHVNRLVQSPVEAMFDLDGKRISVLQYFKQHKGYNIQHQKLPCLWVGSRDRKIYMPPELCTIPVGQVFNRKLNEIQTRTVIKTANNKTRNESAVALRKRKILDLLHDVGFDKDPIMQDFGLTVGTNFEKIKGRLLPSPDLQYSKGLVTPRNGVWYAKQFLQAQKLDNWTIVNLDEFTREDSLHEFVKLLKKIAANLGMDIKDPKQPFQHMVRFQQSSFLNLLELHKQKNLVFVVVPDKPPNIYSKVKQAAELTIGCLTQCIRSKTINRIDETIVGNILLKVNAKLNGYNHSIANRTLPECLNEPCMIMGADVTHPSPDQRDIPSVAAVTASCDRHAFQYNFCWRLQPARQEIIGDLENIMREQLVFFYNRNNSQWPRHIIFFRDGVSEGQFKQVMNMEMQAMRNACAKMGTPNTYKPYITFLVVQKRHHTRFFPCEGSKYKDRNENMLAGTVVDTVITHPTDLEYYLVSHASIQGVSRPTKYRVLWDDKNMSEDELEILTYYLCHMFSRCTRSVSYPAPTYYAHLAAFRARHYLEGHKVNLDNLIREQKNHEICEEIVSRKPMFFV